MSISFDLSRDSGETASFLKKLLNYSDKLNLDTIGQKGVDALRSATPTASSKTAASWKYRIVKKRDSTTVEWYNTNMAGRTPVAILLQYGHATKNGGYVRGRDFINPAIQPLFDELAEKAWKVVRDG